MDINFSVGKNDHTDHPVNNLANVSLLRIMNSILLAWHCAKYIFINLTLSIMLPFKKVFYIIINQNCNIYCNQVVYYARELW